MASLSFNAKLPGEATVKSSLHSTLNHIYRRPRKGRRERSSRTTMPYSVFCRAHQEGEIFVTAIEHAYLNQVLLVYTSVQNASQQYTVEHNNENKTLHVRA